MQHRPFRHPLATHAAGTVLGYRRNGSPIHAIAGGNGAGEGAAVTPPAPGDPGQPPAPPSPADPPATGEPDPKDWQAEAEKWKKLSRENEARAKANADAAKRLAEVEDAQKSEAEKLADRLKAAEDRAAQATQDAFAAKVEALASGRFADPQDAVDALRPEGLIGADGRPDPAAIEQALTDLLGRKPHWAPPESGPRTPRPDPSQGPRPGGTVGIEAQIAEAKAKGDWKSVLRLENSKLAKLPTPK